MLKQKIISFDIKDASGVPFLEKTHDNLLGGQMVSPEELRLAGLPIARVLVNRAIERKEIVAAVEKFLAVIGHGEIDEIYIEASSANLKFNLKIEMINIPAGIFIMGSRDIVNARPLRDVSLSSFNIGRYPVTNEQYGSYLLDTGKDTGKDVPPSVAEAVRAIHPVTVSLEDAWGFCAWLSEITGKKFGDPKFGLPTEAQWEYAVRGVSSDGVSAAGNIWEWTEDQYRDRYNPDDLRDPYFRDGEINLTTPHVVRGGSWPAAKRKGLCVWEKKDNVGFRVVLSNS